VSLETLVDSPVIAGEYFRTIDLATEMKPSHKLDIVADSAAALEIKPEDAGHFSHLVTEANALFGAHHYRSYHFLLTLSEHVAHFGLEHHESSDNRRPEKYLIDEDALKVGGSLLPHEMAHSWNGKYRRPAGLATPDFEQPMEGELLWVYEGLTTYLGNLLATRNGLWTNADFCDEVAQNAAALDRLLHPDLTYSHSDGKTQTKADILKALPNTQSITFGESSVRVYGNTALVKGPVEFVNNAANGATTTLNLSVLQVWLKGPNGWQLVARHSTKLITLP